MSSKASSDSVQEAVVETKKEEDDDVAIEPEVL